MILSVFPVFLLFVYLLFCLGEKEIKSFMTLIDPHLYPKNNISAEPWMLLCALKWQKYESKTFIIYLCLEVVHRGQEWKKIENLWYGSEYNPAFYPLFYWVHYCLFLYKEGLNMWCPTWGDSVISFFKSHSHILKGCSNDSVSLSLFSVTASKTCSFSLS